MPRVHLHGAPISWSFEAPPPDPLAEILEPFGPIISDNNDKNPPSGGVLLNLREAPPSAADKPDDEGYTPAFFLGIIQAYRGPPGGHDPSAPRPILFWNRASRVHVPLDGSPIEALIAPADREITPGSTAAMLHAAVSLALRRERLFHLHAAAVVHPSGAPILIAGVSGAGKTTTTIGLIESGCAYLGDEAIFVRGPDSPDAAAPSDLLAFPRVFHVSPTTLTAFPRLAPLASPRVGQPSKLALDPRIAWPHRARLTSPPPRVALFPSVTGATSTELLRMSPTDALGQLIASSAAIFLEGVPGRTENITSLRRLVETADAYELRLGADALQSPVDVLSNLIGSALNTKKA